MNALGAALLLLVGCLLLGGLPLIDWLLQGLTGKRLAQLGTGNISVSAAFQQGGPWVGLLAVLSEAGKGIGAVLLARFLFPELPAWEIVALVALVVGRYRFARGAGTTNVFWGYVAHDWVVPLGVLVLSLALFTLTRRRHLARLVSLVLLPIVEAGRRPQQSAAIAATTLLSLLIAWIYRRIPDDLALSADTAAASSRPMMRYLQGQPSLLSLDDRPQVQKMGQKAATLAQLKQLGYPVPPGWVLPATTAATAAVQAFTARVSPPWKQPWIVRSSALDEDQPGASAAGQYLSVASIREPAALEEAIARCQQAYGGDRAVTYRRDRGLKAQSGLALLIQQQIPGQYAGVAFSRDPVEPGEAVLVEALAGGPEQIVSGQVTPEQYRLLVDEKTLAEQRPATFAQLSLPEPAPEGRVPLPLVEQVARLARHLERYFHGVPQDIEWIYDGQQLWLLQARPITTLLPIWTRKIAAEVIPGVIRPLTWSLNQPLTCGVWGNLFSQVLGHRAAGLDFRATATLHYARAYFNATLLGQIFRRMGLPPESLEFLTLGAQFSRPPLLSILRNLPGLLRLLQQEWTLVSAFAREEARWFTPALTSLAQSPPTQLSDADLLTRIETILTHLERVTYYNILAPLSFALRRTLLGVPEADLDFRHLPEVASLEAIKQLAGMARQRCPKEVIQADPAQPSADAAGLLERLRQIPEGQSILAKLTQVIDDYGYLSEVGTDIAVPTWREDPRPVQELFAQYCQVPPTAAAPAAAASSSRSWQQRQVQRRLDLKGRVATVYLHLLAQLRWSFVEWEQRAIARGLLQAPGDAFFLTDEEVRQWFTATGTEATAASQARVHERRSQFQQYQRLSTVPGIVYGNTPPPDPTATASLSTAPTPGLWQGIGASPGEAQGPVKVLTTLQGVTAIAPGTIVVVPYTDAGWAPVLAQATGLVAEVGGRLSHGAIVAREYGIPAVMNIANATQQFQDGELIRIDGRAGTVQRLG